MCGSNLNALLSPPYFTTPLLYIQKANLLDSLSVPQLTLQQKAPLITLWL